VAVQEDFIASGGTTLLKLDDYIQHCDVVIHLLGDATGALPENLAVTSGHQPAGGSRAVELAGGRHPARLYPLHRS
jgi:hypothetical protein